MTKTLSLKLEEDLFLDIKKISEIFNISCSEFVRNAIKKEIEEKKNDFMVRMSNVPYCDEEEEKELLGLLENLTDDDLKIVKKETIEL
jgi:metal-responsive CopG/Arc/MetJ family transcriptional regulator